MGLRNIRRRHLRFAHDDTYIGTREARRGPWSGLHLAEKRFQMAVFFVMMEVSIDTVAISSDFMLSMSITILTTVSVGTVVALPRYSFDEFGISDDCAHVTFMYVAQLCLTMKVHFMTI